MYRLILANNARQGLGVCADGPRIAVKVMPAARATVMTWRLANRIGNRWNRHAKAARLVSIAPVIR